MAAKKVLRRAGPEAIAGERVSPSHEFEIMVRHDDVNEAGHPAHGAITVERGHRRFGEPGFEPHRAAMTSTENPHGTALGERRRSFNARLRQRILRSRPAVFPGARAIASPSARHSRCSFLADEISLGSGACRVTGASRLSVSSVKGFERNSRARLIRP